MAGSSNALSDSIWPGYVAAMASLLLSLLLVAAVLVFTISQIGSISETYLQSINNIGFQSSQQVDKLARIAGISDEVTDEATADLSGATVPVGKTNAPPANKIEAANARVIAEQKPKQNKPLDINNANFDAQAARQAADLTAGDRALLAQIDLSKVDVSQINFKGIDISKINLEKAISVKVMAQIDFSRVNFGNLSKERVNVLKPFIAKEGIRYALALQKVQAAQPAPRPIESVRLPPAPVAQPEPEPEPEPPPRTQEILVTYVEDSLDPSPEQQQAIVQAVSQWLRPEAKLRVWVNLPNEDIYLKRVAYARLMAVRSMVLKAGVSTNRVGVAIEVVPSMAPLSREMVVHIAEVKP